MTSELLPPGDRLIFRLLGVAGLVIVVSGLKLAKDLFVTLSLAALLSVILSPLVNLLRKLRLPKALAVGAVVGSVLASVALASTLLVRQAASLGKHVPEYRQNLHAKFEELKGPLARPLRAIRATLRDVEEAPGRAEPGAPARLQMAGSPDAVFALLSSAIIPSLGVLGTAVVILILVSFFLVYSGEIHDRIILLAGASADSAPSEAISESMTGVVRYLSLQAVVNLCHGSLMSLGLWVLGVPSALLWGAAGGLLRFVPYLGPALGCLLPVILSIAAFPGWSRALWVAGFVGALETLNAYGVEPLVYGKRTGLSPLAIIVSALFWTWLWGGPGLLLSIPLTVCLLSLGKHLPSLRFLRVLLGREPGAEA